MSNQSKALIIIQFSCLAYLVLFTSIIGQGILLAVQLFGFIVSFWAVIMMRLGNFNIQPEVKSTAKFITTGPYHLIRNPMYTGLILFFGAAVFSSLQIIQLLVVLVLMIVLILKIRLEEKYLEARFGKTYIEYKQKTSRLIPYLF